MKISTRCSEPPQQVRQINEVLCNQISHFAFSLPSSVNAQQSCIEQFLALLFPHPFPDDDLHGTIFVLKRHKNDSLGRFRLLAKRHDTAGPH